MPSVVGRMTKGAVFDGVVVATEIGTDNNWKVFYADDSGEMVELALGATSGHVLTTNGAAAAPSWTAAAGGGSGSMTTVKANDVQVGGADIVTLDFGPEFGVAESPDKEMNVTARHYRTFMHMGG